MEAHLRVSITVRWLDCVYAVAMEESDRSLTLGFTSYRGGVSLLGIYSQDFYFDLGAPVIACRTASPTGVVRSRSTPRTRYTLIEHSADFVVRGAENLGLFFF